MTPKSLKVAILITISSIAALDGAHISIFLTEALTSIVIIPYIV
jgi:hypothetical protein